MIIINMIIIDYCLLSLPISYCLLAFAYAHAMGRAQAHAPPHVQGPGLGGGSEGLAPEQGHEPGPGPWHGQMHIGNKQ